MPVVCHRPARSNLTVITRYFFAQQSGGYKLKPKGSIRVGFRCLYPICVIAYLLMWLTLITITTGMCLMNVYEFVKVRPSPQFFVIKEETGGSEYFSFHLFPHLNAIFQPTISKSFSNF
jgi:hypothetical protein